MNILIALFSFFLVLLCLFTVLVVMVQKPKGDGGMGAAIGGGSMEAALGAETGSLLTKITIYTVIGFFVLTFMLYLGNIASKKTAEIDSSGSLLSEIVNESEVKDPASDVTSDSALQAALQTGEESVNNAAADLAEEAAAATGDVKSDVEKATKP